MGEEFGAADPITLARERTTGGPLGYRRLHPGGGRHGFPRRSRIHLARGQGTGRRIIVGSDLRNCRGTLGCLELFDVSSLWQSIAPAGAAIRGEFHGRGAVIAVAELAGGSIFGAALESLRGRSVLLATARAIADGARADRTRRRGAAHGAVHARFDAAAARRRRRHGAGRCHRRRRGYRTPRRPRH